MSKEKSDGQVYEEISRKSNPELHAEIDNWLDNFLSTQEILSKEDQQLIEDNFWELVKDE